MRISYGENDFATPEKKKRNKKKSLPCAFALAEVLPRKMLMMEYIQTERADAVGCLARQ